MTLWSTQQRSLPGVCGCSPVGHEARGLLLPERTDRSQRAKRVSLPRAEAGPGGPGPSFRDPPGGRAWYWGARGVHAVSLLQEPGGWPRWSQPWPLLAPLPHGPASPTRWANTNIYTRRPGCSSAASRPAPLGLEVGAGEVPGGCWAARVGPAGALGPGAGLQVTAHDGVATARRGGARSCPGLFGQFSSQRSRAAGRQLRRLDAGGRGGEQHVPGPAAGSGQTWGPAGHGAPPGGQFKATGVGGAGTGTGTLLEAPARVCHRKRGLSRDGSLIWFQEKIWACLFP